jgi:hypothetical protein
VVESKVELNTLYYGWVGRATRNCCQCKIIGKAFFVCPTFSAAFAACNFMKCVSIAQKRNYANEIAFKGSEHFLNAH